MNCDMSESRDLSLHRLLPLLEPDKIKTVLFFFVMGALWQSTALASGQVCVNLGRQERKGGGAGVQTLCVPTPLSSTGELGILGTQYFLHRALELCAVQ